ncbi:hypothetical protein SCA6_013066 [Theobroma cacao]
MGSSSKEETATDADTSSGDTPPSNSNVFSEGERVLAYHGPRIYEAKAEFKKLSFGRRNGNTLFITLVGIKSECALDNMLSAEPMLLPYFGC